MLIWDFDVDDVLLSLTASRCSVKAKIPSKLTSIAYMPYQDPKSVKSREGFAFIVSHFSGKGHVIIANAVVIGPKRRRKLIRGGS